jgi:putative endopeptidase
MVKSVIRLAAAIAVVAGLFSAHIGTAAEVAVAPGSPQAIESAKHGFDLSNMDPTCRACDDFYRYTNGGWLDRHPLDAQHSRLGGFTTLAEQNQTIVHTILEKAAAGHGAPGSPEQLTGDLYASCMDTAARDAAGVTPLNADFTVISRTTLSDMPATVAALQNDGIPAFFTFGGGTDQKDSNSIIAQAGEGGLGMPERDYYFKSDTVSANLRDLYAAHVKRSFVLAGDDDATAQTEATAAIGVESALARVTRLATERRDPLRNYNKLAVTEFSGATPHFDWAAYFKARHAPAFTAINTPAPKYFGQFDTILTSTPVTELRSYLRWRAIDRYEPSLSTAFVDEAFSWTGKALAGTSQQLEPWKRCATSVDQTVGQALGVEYVRVAFPPAARTRARELVHNVEAALRDDLRTLSWMSPETRTQAIAKLDDIKDKIGYADVPRDYKGLTLDRGIYAANVLRGARYETARGIGRIGTAVDRAEFSMTPPTVNARYSPTLNDILFPAGILQPPFFNPNADDAINYGGIGAVIGHEMTHGFDDSGRHYDGKGNLRDWWTAADAAAYDTRASCVEHQFDNFVAVKGANGQPDLHQTGKLVLGESIADLGGMTIAYKAFKKTPEGQSMTKIDGFTPDQRFFLGYAQIWPENDTEKAARLRVATDPHPLNNFRVLAPLSNTPEFATAFQCKLGDPMVRSVADRCQIW